MVKNYIPFLIIVSLLLICGCTTLTNSNNGTIITNSTPIGADVYLNNTYNGTTPNTINSVPPGAYQIEFRLKNYQTYSESINIQSNEVHHFSVSLIPITPTPVPIQTKADIQNMNSSLVATLGPGFNGFVCSSNGTAGQGQISISGC